MIHVREANIGDAGGLAELNRSFNGVTIRAGDIERRLQDDGSSETVLVAEDSGDLVGFACFQTLRSLCAEAPWTEITELYVAAGHRRGGAGKALVEEAIRRAEQVGASEILARTNLKNDAAQSLFTRVGLKPEPHVVFRTRLA